MKPTFSIVICAYNEEKYIKECLESVVRHAKGKFLEIIVVDNASTDRTREIAESVPGVRVVTESSKGLTKARQCGLEHSKGDVIIYLDADTHITEGWIERAEKEYVHDAKLVCVSGLYRYKNLSWFSSMIVWIYWNIFSYPISLITGYMVVGGNFAAKRQALLDIGGFDTSIAFYGEDTDIGKRLHAVGHVKLLPSVYVYTSSRRLENEGVARTGARYIQNFFSIVWKGKPATKDYTDFR